MMSRVTNPCGVRPAGHDEPGYDEAGGLEPMGGADLRVFGVDPTICAAAFDSSYATWLGCGSTTASSEARRPSRWACANNLLLRGGTRSLNAVLFELDEHVQIVDHVHAGRAVG